MKSIGLARGRVRLNEYQPEWESAFASVRVELANNLRNLACDIQHIGGTSIPGMVAKPILDIGIGLSPEVATNHAAALLQSLSYSDRGVYGRDGGIRLLQKLDADGLVIHHIHLMAITDRNWTLCLGYRDMLRENGFLFKQLIALKRSLAGHYPNNRTAYTEGKTNFVDHVHDLLSQQTLPAPDSAAQGVAPVGSVKE